jgi:hypothetical protein
MEYREFPKSASELVMVSYDELFLEVPLRL